MEVELLKPKSLLVPTIKELEDSSVQPSDDLASIDHFLCYAARARGLPKGMQVLVTDQFDRSRRRYDLKKITRLCTPVDKSGEPTILSGTYRGQAFPIEPAIRRGPTSHLVCYKAKLATKEIAQNGCGAAETGDRGVRIDPRQPKHDKVRNILTINQFGLEQLDSLKEDKFCIPSSKMEHDGD
jgi:hypothetical protein